MSMSFRLCSVRPDELQLLHRPAAARRGHRDRELLPQVLRRERPRLLHQRVERAREHDAPALLAGAEAEIDDVIGDADHVGVVLDDEHRVALIAELPQDGDQPQVVARVQADRRLVEHVERADQRRAERGGQIDALRLAARERRREAIQREVVEADVAEERQPAPDLASAPCRRSRPPSPRARVRSKNACASRTVSADTRSMVRPDTRTSRASRRSRAPPQSGHVR